MRCNTCAKRRAIRGGKQHAYAYERMNENKQTHVMLSTLTKDEGKCDVMKMMTTKPWYAVVSTLFKQTTQDKVVLIMCEDVPQTIMAAAYWFMSPSTSSFIVLFNIIIPILRITFAAVAYRGLRQLAQPWLRDELRTATIDGNEVKVSYVMKHIIGGKVESLVKA